MAKVPPFYSLRQLVYHTNDHCPQARGILNSEKISGVGGKVECLCCRHLTRIQAKKGPEYVFKKRYMAESKTHEH